MATKKNKFRLLVWGLSICIAILITVSVLVGKRFVLVKYNYLIGSSKQKSKDYDGAITAYSKVLTYDSTNYDLYFVKLSSTGNVIMNKTAGSAGTETGQDIAITSGGYYLVAGYSDNIGSGLNDMYLVKFDPSGNICSGCNPGTGGNLNTGGNIGTGGTAATGGTVSTGGTLGQGGTLSNVCTTTEIYERFSKNSFAIYPNPTNESIIISLNEYASEIVIKLFDMTGNLILSTNVQRTTIAINLNDFASGIYIIEVNGKKSKLVKS